MNKRKELFEAVCAILKILNHSQEDQIWDTKSNSDPPV
jgi:hypothetical protein